MTEFYNSKNKRKSCDTIDDDITAFFGTIGTKGEELKLSESKQFEEIVEQAKKNAGEQMVLRSNTRRKLGGADLTREEKQGLVSLLIISIYAYDKIVYEGEIIEGLTDPVIETIKEYGGNMFEGAKHIFNGLLKGYLKRIGKENVCDNTFDYLIDTIPNFLPLTKAPGKSCAVNLVEYTENLEKVKTDIIGYVLLSMGAGGAYFKTKYPDSSFKDILTTTTELTRSTFNTVYDSVSYVVTLPFIGLGVINKTAIGATSDMIDKLTNAFKLMLNCTTSGAPTTAAPTTADTATIDPNTDTATIDPNTNGGRRKKKTLKMKKMKKVKKVKKTHKKKQRKTIKLKHKKGKKTRKH